MPLIPIKKARQIRGYTLADLAEKTGFDTRYLNRIERGEQPASKDARMKIAAALNLEPHDLFDVLALEAAESLEGSAK